MANCDSTSRHLSSRAEAKALGLKRYFTGAPCVAGHIAERLTINGSCCECSNIRSKAAYHADIKAARAQQAKIRKKHGARRSEKKRALRLASDPAYAERQATLAVDRAAKAHAIAAGLKQFLSTRPCPHGHVGLRFTGDGHCVTCNLLACRVRTGYEQRSQDRAQKKSAIAASKAPWYESHKRRQAALSDNDKHYLGRPCRHGHTGLRYTKTGMCVGCARELSASAEKKAYDKAYFQANRVSILGRCQTYAAKHRERMKLKAKQWLKRHPEKRRAISKAYKARRRQQEAGGDSTAAVFAWEKRAIKACHWCGAKCADDYHVDHYHPLSKGGMHVAANLVIACKTCNLRKNAKDPYEFAASLGRLF